MANFIKNVETVENFIIATVVINNNEFEVTAPADDKKDWGWCGDDNWATTEKNALIANMTESELIEQITNLLSA